MNLFNNLTSSLIERLIYTSHTIHWSSNITTEYWFQKWWCAKNLNCIIKSSSRWHNLSSSSMNSISMELTIHNIKSHSSHILFTKYSLFRSPLEWWNHWFFNFIHILNTFCSINYHIRSCIIGTKTPNFSSVVFLPIKLLCESFSSNFHILSWSNLSVFNKIR